MIFNGKVAPRRVLAVANDHVLFSDGNRKTKECTVKAFEAWLHKYSAEPAQ